MKPAAKVLLITGGAIGLVTLASLLKKSSASDQLILNFSDLNVGLEGPNGFGALKIPKRVLFNVEFDAINPSKEELRFSAPFVRVKATGKDGQDKLIGNSVIAPAAQQIITIPAKSTQKIPILVEAPLLSMLAVFPDYIQYAWGRVHGEPSTRNIRVQYDYEAYGIKQNDESVAAI